MAAGRTHKVFLARANFEADEANDARGHGECSRSKGRNDRSGCLEDALDEERRREHVDDQVARQAKREVEDKWLLSIEHRTCAFFQRPLHRDVFTAEECVVEEARQIAGNDEGSHEQQDLAHRSVTVEIEESPVESQHAELGKAQPKVIEVV